ncbi:MAG: MCE family protein [Chroococcus sp. CMT-3BRIN-NPC107]|jgi:phospholipid/cholesterol/gamma-HCH transport system substrate-binding protein|nr:MCE family protein [Chroococcus sp. CMT-3BRIN-NPC107]
MRSRTVREGSVGLLILLGIGLLGGFVLWLRGVQFNQRSYKAIVSFTNVGGIQDGAAVRYRGVSIGSVVAIKPGANSVEVEIEISPADVIIPRNAVIEANQSGLISEVSIDITPVGGLSPQLVVAKPLDENCDRNLIVCDGSRLQGQIGISLDALIRSSTNFATIYGNPKLYANLNTAVNNAAAAAAGVTELTRELEVLSKSTRQQLGTFSGAATSVQQAANEISASTSKTITQFGSTADQLNSTTANVNRLVNNVDSLVTTNRSTLVTTLNNLNQISEQLQGTFTELSPTINRVNQGQLIQNLETLSTNAAEASANLRNASNALNDPNNILVLQQTLDSARVTFANAQKITSDLDELTGDPEFRQNVRQIVDGLSGLVSSTQQLEQQVQVAESLAPTAEETLNMTANGSPISIMPNFDNAEFSLAQKTLKPILPTTEEGRKEAK